jgi:hypothetical protein
MTLRKRAGGGLFAVAVAALAVGLGATSALARTATWTVKPGGSYTATTTKTVLTDSKTGAALTCVSTSTSPASKASGTLKSGSGLSNPLGTVAAASFNNCSGPAGLKFKVTTSHLPWHVNGTSYSSGTATGNISGIHAVLTGTNNTCKATVDGTGATANNGKVTIKHTNGTAGNKLTFTGGGNLHTYNVSAGCLGAINSGDAVSFKATYTLNKAQTITSP